MARSSWLGPHELLQLDHWARLIVEAFGEVPYLVGSCARGEPFRDVDVRLMLDAEQFAAITTGGNETCVRVLNIAFTEWAKHVTGLPVDFQFQEANAANEEYGDQIRNPLGLRWEDARIPSRTTARAAREPIQEAQ